MATHSSTLAWKIPWTEEPGGLKVQGVAKSRTWLSNFTFTLLKAGMCCDFQKNREAAGQAPLVAVQLPSRVQLFPTQWTAARQPSLLFTIFHSLLKLMSIESVMPSNHLILCHLLLPLPSFLPSIRVFSSESAQVASSSQSTGASASASVLLMNIQDWFPLGLTRLSSLKSKELSRVFSSTTIWKHQFFGAQPSLWSSFHIYITTALEWTELNSPAPRTKGVPILCGLFFLKSFYWSTVDLQYCVSFHFTASWFSHIYTYIRTYIHSFF